MNKDECGVNDEFKGWQALVSKYQQPNMRKGIWQLVNSFGGFLLSLVLMYFSLPVGYWLTLLLALPTAGFLVRIFIIQHDCGHNSFFKSRKANDIVGVFSSLVTFVSYRYWRKCHSIHHAHHAELEERGIGDVWTLTVDEYWKAAWWKKLAYRIFRNPIFLFGIAPAINFIILERFPLHAKRGWRTGEHAGIWLTNIAIVGWVTVVALLIGFGNTVMIFLPAIILAASVGTWLFYVQHQLEHTYWEHSQEWDYTLAAMQGSSYYKLPKVLQWFTGNIGFHHIHHLSPRIPNYHLEDCHKENPLFQRVVVLTLMSSFRTVLFALWDEEKERLVSFKEALKTKQNAITT